VRRDDYTGPWQAPAEPVFPPGLELARDARSALTLVVWRGRTVGQWSDLTEAAGGRPAGFRMDDPDGQLRHAAVRGEYIARVLARLNDPALADFIADLRAYVQWWRLRAVAEELPR
jgi:hypothetical protein